MTSTNVKNIIRRNNWGANKRSLDVVNRIDHPVLDNVQRLHAEGLYEEALNELTNITGWQGTPRALRLAGLCQLGLKNFDHALDAFDQAQSINVLEIAKDNVNKATTLIAAGDLDAASDAANKALQGAPQLLTPHICLLSIANRSRNSATIETAVRDFVTDYPDLLQDECLIERFENDPDLIGISVLINQYKDC